MCLGRLLIVLGRSGNLVTGSVLRSYIRSLVGPFSEIFSAVVNHPIICFAYGRQKCAAWQFEVVEGIPPCGVGFLFLVFYVVDPNAYDSIAAIPAF